jgi:hypothetical protein
MHVPTGTNLDPYPYLSDLLAVGMRIFVTRGYANISYLAIFSRRHPFLPLARGIAVGRFVSPSGRRRRRDAP